MAAGSTVLLLVMRATSETGDGDPFDSPMYVWSWLLLPMIAAVAARKWPTRRPAVWAIALMLPMAVGVAVIGTVLHDPDDGASLWIAGEVFVLVQGLAVWGAAAAARPRSAA